MAIVSMPACEGVMRTATRWDNDLQKFFGTAPPAQPPQTEATAAEGNPAPSEVEAPEVEVQEVRLVETGPEVLPAAIAGLHEAAVRGDAEAQFELGDAYETGRLVDADIAWAARWYGRAAYRDHSEAQYRYGRLKLEGRGLPKDRGGAYRWLALAARQGHPEATETLADLELSLGIDQLYRERAWVDTFQPTTGIALPDPPSVEYLQGRLARLDFDPGPPDGSMGPRTVAALESYQAERGLEPTGRFSEALLETIRADRPQGG
jgi:hypothetical protein